MGREEGRGGKRRGEGREEGWGRGGKRRGEGRGRERREEGLREE